MILTGTDPAIPLSNVDGVFEFIDIPAGPGHLHIDGFVATTLDGNPIPEGSYPALAYEVVIIENAENTLPTPIILPELDITNAVTYDGTQDVELTVDGVEGLKMTVKAGSMRRTDGSAPSPANPAILSLDQVHHDDVPMPMPDGVSPLFAWTLQPAGATFDPPIQIEYPNMTGLPAGSISYFLSFNHDTNRFEIVASGTVSEDGSTIISDPGVGISVAGWGCNCPPYAVAGACINCAVDCLETGSLSAGEGAADKSLVCVGESVTFSVTIDSVDNGGIKQFNCPDSTITDFDGPVTPSYSWVISGPGNPVSGNGNTVTFTPPTNGTYSCQFTATANRDCPPAPVSFSGGSFVAAAVTSIDSSDDVVCVGESVTFTANGGPFPAGSLKWAGGENPPTATDTTSFTTDWSTPGTKTVTVKCGSSSVSKTLNVVVVGSVSNTGDKCAGDSVGFFAFSNPASPWPPGEPVWQITAGTAVPSSGNGNTAVVTPSAGYTGPLTIQFRCGSADPGTTSSVNIVGVNNIIGPTIVNLNDIVTYTVTPTSGNFPIAPIIGTSGSVLSQGFDTITVLWEKCGTHDVSAGCGTSSFTLPVTVDPAPLVDFSDCDVPDRIVNPNYPGPVPNGCGAAGSNLPIPQLWYEPACNNHDICYGTCNNVKSSCDFTFEAEMLVGCDVEFPPPRSPSDEGLYTACRAAALIYYAAVAITPQANAAYLIAQQQACLCCRLN